MYTSKSVKKLTQRAISITIILGLILSSLALSASFVTKVQAVAALNNAYNRQHVAINDANGNTANTTDFKGTTIKLTEDIDLNAHEWVPIGLADNDGVHSTKVNVFKGNFNGTGETIKNMNISGDYKYAGIFGYAEFGKIENINTAKNLAKLGGIVGQAVQININNCNNAGTVTSSSYAGGVAGQASGTK